MYVKRRWVENQLQPLTFDSEGAVSSIQHSLYRGLHIIIVVIHSKPYCAKWASNVCNLLATVDLSAKVSANVIGCAMFHSL